MIAYKDDNPTRTFPFVTIALISINIMIFIWELMQVERQQIPVLYGAIPHNLITLEGDQPISPPLSIFTSMFLHAGVLHVAGNMLYLWIFGNNIEDSLGHFRFLLFYLFSGIVAALGHAFTTTQPMLPMIGASGAVSGVLGAYILLFPNAKVHTLIFFGFFFQVVRVPAVIVLGFWILLQFINSFAGEGAVHGGVAWFAHIGGFIAGLITIKIWLIGVKRSFS